MPPAGTSRRRRGSKSPSVRERSKRQRLVTAECEDDNIQNTTGPSEPNQSESPVQTESSQVLTYDDAVELTKKPISFQIERYKEWRRNGSVNERVCRICHKPDGLEPCHTCRMALHVRCTPQGWARGSDSEWFCPLCVSRNWHTNPPVLTPPASPGLPPDQTGVLTGGAPPSSTTAQNSTANDRNTLQNIVRVAPDSVPPQEVVNTVPPAATISAYHATPNHGTESPATHTTSQEPPRPTRRPRKSRFATLSTEVDASLSVLYRELESIASLKLEIDELKQENAKNLQVISIRDQNLMALRRQIQNQSASDQEIRHLRAKAAGFDALSKENEELRAKNSALEADLKTSREQAARANEILTDWKGKLSQLMNT